MTFLGRLAAILLTGGILGAAAALYAVANPVSIAGVSLRINVPSIQAAPPVASSALQLSAPVQGREAPLLKQGGDASVSDVYQRVSSAVVNITFSSTGRDGLGPVQAQEGSGSGFIIDNQGHIATNHHVAAAGNRLHVTLADGSSYVGQLLGSDIASDLAIVQVKAPNEVLQNPSSSTPSGRLIYGPAYSILWG